MSASDYRVLGVDDSEDDLFLLRRALSKTPNLRMIACVGNGQEAIAYLQAQGRFTDRKQWPAPDVILLDLKMPILDGFGVLEWLRGNPQADLRVFVFTSSLNAADRNRALEMGADNFYVKPTSPAGYDKFAATIRQSLMGDTEAQSATGPIP